GFEAGDVDFHLQRPEPEFKRVKEYRVATRGYEDGDKQAYRAGYQEGYKAGYQDGKTGRPFIAIQQLQSAAAHKPVVLAENDSDSWDSDNSDSDNDDTDQLGAVTIPAQPLKIPVNALFAVQQAVLPPSPSAKDS